MIEWYKPYGVREAYVFPFTESTATWGTGIKLRNMIMFKLTPKHDTDIMPVYGRDEKGLSVVRGGDIEMQLGGVQNDTDEVMTGRTSRTSGSGATEKRTRDIGDDSLPYFGLAVALKTKNDIGDVHIYCPNVMLSSLLALDLTETAKFSVPNVPAMLFGLSSEAGDRYRLWYEVELATKTALGSDFEAMLTANIPDGSYLIT